MATLGTEAPDFTLPDSEGRLIALTGFEGAPALLVMFICNHCPYVKHVAGELARLGRDYRARGVAIVAINSNDAANYPEDSPAKMKDEVRLRGYTFPYLYDETQQVAKAYQAACTPDFFLYDQNKRLIYRGQLDDSRPGDGTPVTGKDLRAALDQLLSGATVDIRNQRPSMGCNIKWKANNAPAYAP
jgi:peroxiredoxin